MINTEKIPVSLRSDALFCCWQYEEREGKKTKIPYNPRTGRRGQSNNSDTFSDFDTAVKASGAFSGVGVGIFNNVCAIDLDHCFNADGTLAAEAQDIVTAMNSYTERSPSGTGIHILFKAEGFVYDKVKYYINNQKSGIEVYVYGATNKYLTLTGDALFEGREIEERSAALSVILNRYMQRKQTEPNVTERVPEEPTRLSLPEPKPLILFADPVLQRAAKAKNSEKFLRLWGGDYSGYTNPKTGEPDHSAGDQALCNILAFHAKGDTATVDRLFRESGLYRAKWDELHGAMTYGASTVSKACENETVQEVKKNAELINRPYIYSEGDKNKVSAPDLAEYIRDNLNYFFIRTDGSGAWRYIYSDGVYRMVSDDFFKGYIKREIPAELHSVKTVNEVFGLLITDIDRDRTLDMLNADRNIINFKNGYFHIDTDELTPHTPDIFSTTQLPCNYNPNAVSPKNGYWDKYLSTLGEGDPQRIALLLEYFGLAISNIPGGLTKKCLILCGAANSGKSVYRNVLYGLLGNENCASIDLKTINRPFGTSVIYNKRICGDADLSYVAVDEMTVFKHITCGDPIFVEFKGKQGKNAIYTGVVLFCANELPKFGGDKSGDQVYDRLIILPCDNVVPLGSRIPFVHEKILNEESEYLVSLAVKHLRNFIARGYKFDIPECCTEALRQYKTENSPTLRFLAECTMERPHKLISDKCNTAMLYKIFCAWCKTNNSGYTESKQIFKRFIDNAGKGTIKKTNGGNWYYTDFMLTLECKQEYSYIYGFDTVTPEANTYA